MMAEITTALAAVGITICACAVSNCFGKLRLYLFVTIDLLHAKSITSSVILAGRDG